MSKHFWGKTNKKKKSVHSQIGKYKIQIKTKMGCFIHVSGKILKI